MRPFLVTPPSEEPVSLADFKKQVPLDFSDDDAGLYAIIRAAAAHFDGYSGTLGRCLVSQEWQQGYCAWDSSLPLPFPDVSGAVVGYVDADGVDQVVPAAQFEIVQGHFGSRIVFRPAFTWPALSADLFQPVHVRFTAGYGDATAVPENLKVAIIHLAASWYDGKAEPASVAALTAPFRMVTP